ncbi:MAG: uroporphyrinogen-III C-methyltransferase [Burkholderiales bacterium]|nr:uroporphyrinogen-III C-methyltransferase [Burkholderiales bacterium]
MGKVYLIGAGPGAADLITLRGARLLEQADVVFYDALVHADMLALAGNATKVAVGKRCGRVSTDQRFINRQLVEAASKYAIVVRLKGGDPMLFGRAREEIAALEHASVEYEIVPGVTSALAAHAELGVSLTERGVARSVVFATPRVGSDQEASDWAAGVCAADTAVLYMAAGQGAQISEALQAAGMHARTPVAIVENASLANARRILTTLEGLRDIGDWQISGPALVCIGEVYGTRLRMAEAVTAAGEETAQALAMFSGRRV